MKTFKNFIIESKEINLAKKAYNTLSPQARNEIREWESGTSDSNSLEKHILNNTDIAIELETAFKPIRDFLKNKHGQTITLYRGIIKGKSLPSTRILQSYTSDYKIAEIFAGFRDMSGNSMYYPEYSISDINKAYSKLKSKGFAMLNNKKYLRSKNDPDYISIYQGNDYLTDMEMDSFVEDMKDELDEIKKYNKQIQNNGKIIKDHIDIDNIIWITNNLNSKEYIVKPNNHQQ